MRWMVKQLIRAGAREGLALAVVALALVSLGTENIAVRLRIRNQTEEAVSVRIEGEGELEEDAHPRGWSVSIAPGQSLVVYYRSTGGCETIHADGRNLRILSLRVHYADGRAQLLSHRALLRSLTRDPEDPFGWVLEIR